MPKILMSGMLRGSKKGNRKHINNFEFLTLGSFKQNPHRQDLLLHIP